MMSYEFRAQLARYRHDRQTHEKTQRVNRQSVKNADVKKITARATSASAKLADRQVPADHTRSAGVKRPLAEWQSLRR